MRIAVLGVTRPVGHKFAQIAADNGHFIRALVRGSEARIPSDLDQHPNIVWVTGDATSAKDLNELIKGCEGIFACLGAGLKKTTINADFTRTLIPLLTPDIKLIIIGNVGVGRSFAKQNLIAKTFLKTWMASIRLDKTTMENNITSSNLKNYVVLRAQRLRNKNMDLGKVKILDDAHGSVFGKTKREDLAGIALEIFEGKRDEIKWQSIVTVVSK